MTPTHHGKGNGVVHQIPAHAAANVASGQGLPPSPPGTPPHQQSGLGPDDHTHQASHHLLDRFTLTFPTTPYSPNIQQDLHSTVLKQIRFDSKPVPQLATPGPHGIQVGRAPQRLSPSSWTFTRPNRVHPANQGQTGDAPAPFLFAVWRYPPLCSTRSGDAHLTPYSPQQR